MLKEASWFPEEETINAREHIIKLLIDLRSNWSEEIPNTIVHGEEHRYKVRNNWFNNIRIYTEMANAYELLTPETIEKINAITAEWDEEFSFRPKTASDIQKGNELIDLLISSLERSE